MHDFVSRLLKWLGLAAAALLVVAIGFAAFWLFALTRDLPSVETLQVYEPPITTRVYAGNGTVLGEFAHERRIFVPATFIPKLVKQAFTAAEDRNFYSHPGIDPSGILRAAINPLASAKQTIELPGPRAKVQSHTAVPGIYVNIDGPATAGTAPAKGELAPLPPAERFKIVRAEIKNGKRIAGGIKIAPYGKVKADERFVPATVQELSGGWVKVSPRDPLPTGEYAVAEMLGKEGMNLYVWDFGVNPSAPANASALKSDEKDVPQK